MRKSATLWLVLAAISGGVLFHTSQRVTDGRAELDKIVQNLRKEDESLRVLQAEWSYLNQPERLEKLAKKLLHLSPLKGAQIVKPEDIATRLQENPASENKDQAPQELDKNTVQIKPPPQRVSPVLTPAPKEPQDGGIKTVGESPRRSFGDVINSLGVR